MISRRSSLVVIVLVLTVIAGGWSLERGGLLPWQTAHYRTAPGEKWIAKLSDGSTFTLDADSALDVRMLRAERRVSLLRGRAFFEVAKDPRRPFVVLVGDRRITSVGTSFEARLQPDLVRVLTVEGLVSVARVGSPAGLSASPSAEPALQVKGGEQFLAVQGAPASVSRVDVVRLTDWQSRHVLFKSEPVAGAAAKSEDKPAAGT